MKQDHLFLGLLWLFFCVFHSGLASGVVKRWLGKKIPALSPYYQLAYTLFAAVTFFYVVGYQLRLPSPLVLSASLKWVGYPVAAAGLAIMLICIKKYFYGLSGLKSAIRKNPVTQELKTDGIHRYVRHPLYLGTFIFIWGLFLIKPCLSLLISNSIIHIYTLIGIRFEEAKLVATFGRTYERYQKSVPRIVPAFGAKRKV